MDLQKLRSKQMKLQFTSDKNYKQWYTRNNNKMTIVLNG